MGGSLSPPRLNILTVGNVGVVICLGQGGLCSLSASSSYSNRLLSCIRCNTMKTTSEQCESIFILVEKRLKQLSI